MVPIGAVLAGRYRVDRVLGQGGMGVVVQAMHLQLHQPVAMKFLLPEVLGSPQVVQRFLREAQAAVRLKSEHVARVLDVGSLEDGAPYIVLEYLDGADLSHFARQQLTIGQIVDLLLQACEALAEAHSLGIVHRDIKPANFFVTRSSDGALLLKVLDFGISKAQQPALEASLTQTSTVMGTPTYMSPEQMKSSRDVDPRSDIWSLGVVLYELLQGIPPFVAETYGAMAIKVATEALPPLAGHLPHGLSNVAYRCLEKDPAKRYQNIAELAHDLAPYAQSTNQAVMTVERTSRVLRTDPPQRLSTLTSSAGAVTRPPSTSRRWPLIAGGLVLVGAIIAVLVAMPRGGGNSAAAADPTPSPAPTPVATPAPPPSPPPAAAPAVPPPDAAIAIVPDDAAVAEPAATPGKPPKKPRKPPAVPGEPKPPTKPGTPDDILETRH